MLNYSLSVGQNLGPYSSDDNFSAVARLQASCMCELLLCQTVLCNLTNSGKHKIQLVPWKRHQSLNVVSAELALFTWHVVRVLAFRHAHLRPWKVCLDCVVGYTWIHTVPTAACDLTVTETHIFAQRGLYSILWFHSHRDGIGTVSPVPSPPFHWCHMLWNLLRVLLGFFHFLVLPGACVSCYRYNTVHFFGWYIGRESSRTHQFCQPDLLSGCTLYNPKSSPALHHSQLKASVLHCSPSEDASGFNLFPLVTPHVTPVCEHWVLWMSSGEKSIQIFGPFINSFMLWFWSSEVLCHRYKSHLQTWCLWLIFHLKIFEEKTKPSFKFNTSKITCALLTWGTCSTTIWKTYSQT